jgi:hypothetical protein
MTLGTFDVLPVFQFWLTVIVRGFAPITTPDVF